MKNWHIQLRIKTLWPFYFAALLLILVPLLWFTSSRFRSESRRRLWPAKHGIRMLHAHAERAALTHGSLIVRYMVVFAFANSIYRHSWMAIGIGMAAGFLCSDSSASRAQILRRLLQSACYSASMFTANQCSKACA